MKRVEAVKQTSSEVGDRTDRRGMAETIQLGWILEGCEPPPTVDSILSNLTAGEDQAQVDAPYWDLLRSEAGRPDGTVVYAVFAEINTIFFVAAEWRSNTRLTLQEVYLIRQRAKGSPKGLAVVQDLVDDALRAKTDPVEVLKAFSRGL